MSSSSSPSTFNLAIDTLALVLCITGALNAGITYGVQAFGLTATHVCLQSGVLHALSLQGGVVVGPSVRVATAGVALGSCVLLYWSLRASQSDLHTLHIGGPAASSAADTAHVALTHIAVPVTTLWHVYDVTYAPLLYVSAIVFINVSAAALLHEWLGSAPADVLQSVTLASYSASLLSSLCVATFIDGVARERERRRQP